MRTCVHGRGLALYAIVQRLQGIVVVNIFLFHDLERLRVESPLPSINCVANQRYACLIVVCRVLQLRFRHTVNQERISRISQFRQSAIQKHDELIIRIESRFRLHTWPIAPRRKSRMSQRLICVCARSLSTTPASALCKKHFSSFVCASLSTKTQLSWQFSSRDSLM